MSQTWMLTLRLGYFHEYWIYWKGCFLAWNLKFNHTEHGDCNICACPSPPHSLWSFQELNESYLRNGWKAANPWTTSHKVCGKCDVNISFDIHLFSCRIFKTKDDITIKISDRGGGMSRRVRRKIFNYMYSTAPKVCSKIDTFRSVFSRRSRCNVFNFDQVVLPNSGGSYGGGLAAAQLPMHGLGYGLPLSRLYARFYFLLFHQPISLNSQLSWFILTLFIIRYFMGDIKLASVDGYGTDTYIYLQVLSLASKYSLSLFWILCSEYLAWLWRTYRFSTLFQKTSSWTLRHRWDFYICSSIFSKFSKPQSMLGARLDGQPEELLSMMMLAYIFDLDQLYQVFYVGYLW